MLVKLNPPAQVVFGTGFPLFGNIRKIFTSGITEEGKEGDMHLRIQVVVQE